MSIAKAFIAELDHESASTRKHLERVPAEKWGYKPHPKSMSAGQLASHIAEMFQWGVTTLTQDEFEFDLANYKPWEASGPDELLGAYDKGIAEFKTALGATSDEAMLRHWKMTANGAPMFEMPRVAVVRSMIMNHMLHHRAQLGVYLRMMDIPVPSAYGPSADEKPS